MSDVDPRFNPVFQRGFDGQQPVPTAVDVAAATATDVPAPEVVASPARAESAVLAPASTASARNPWLAALWVTAAVFTVAAVVAQYIAIEITYSPTPPTAAQEYVIPTVFGALAPTLFAAGLATAIAALVIHALRWQPRD